MKVLALTSPPVAPIVNGAIADVPAVTVAVAGWPRVMEHLSSSHPPDGMVIDGSRVTADMILRLRTLHERRLLVRTCLYLADSAEEALSLAWQGPRTGVVPVFGAMHLLRELRALRTARASWRIGRHLIATTGAHGDAERLIQMLADNTAACTWSTRMIAAELGLGRTALYSALREHGLPPLEQIQCLFRLLPAVKMIQQGASVEDAAYRASYSDGASLRKSLRKRLRLRLIDLRTSISWEQVIATWLRTHDLRWERCEG